MKKRWIRVSRANSHAAVRYWFSSKLVQGLVTFDKNACYARFGESGCKKKPLSYWGRKGARGLVREKITRIFPLSLFPRARYIRFESFRCNDVRASFVDGCSLQRNIYAYINIIRYLNMKSFMIFFDVDVSPKINPRKKARKKRSQFIHSQNEEFHVFVDM